MTCGDNGQHQQSRAQILSRPNLVASFLKIIHIDIQIRKRLVRYIENFYVRIEGPYVEILSPNSAVFLDPTHGGVKSKTLAT